MAWIYIYRLHALIYYLIDSCNVESETQASKKRTVSGLIITFFLLHTHATFYIPYYVYSFSSAVCLSEVMCDFDRACFSVYAWSRRSACAPVT